MLSTIFSRTIADRLRGVAGYSTAAVAAAAMYLSVYPSMADQMASYTEALPEALKSFLGTDLATPAGYLQSSVFAILGPMLVAAPGISWGAHAIAGEEDARTLPLLLSVPVARTKLASQKVAAVLLSITVISVVLVAALVILAATIDIDITPGRLFAATLHLHALGVFSAGVAFGVGAATGRRTWAVAAATGVVVLGFTMAGVAGMSTDLEWLRSYSPFYWYNGSEPVRNGIAAGHLALLYGAGLAAVALGMWCFDRRDLH